MHGLSDASTACRVCRSRDVAFLCETVNEHSRTRLLHHFRCRSCGSVFVGDDIGGDELAEAYDSFDEQKYYAETTQASGAKFAAVARDVAALAPHHAAILDLGGGNGAFIRALKAEDFSNLSIHEIPGGDLGGLSGLVRHVYRDTDYSTVPSDAFDVVTMMDVMEHVPRPAETMAAVKRILRRDGILFLHTPVVTALDRLMHFSLKLPGFGRLARLWQRARTSIFHLQNYTPRSLALLAEREGFTVLRVAPINELSWPLALYVRVYLVDKAGLPRALVPMVTAVAALLVRSPLHANKGVLVARRS
jgi:SAM-dependent methyltransferase